MPSYLQSVVQMYQVYNLTQNIYVTTDASITFSNQYVPAASRSNTHYYSTLYRIRMIVYIFKHDTN